MNSAKSKLKLIALFLVIFVFGIIVGAFGNAYQYQNVVLPFFSTDYAVNTASTLNTICMLRLGETENAIQHLENKIDSDILYMASAFTHMSKTDYSREVLSKARAYRDHFPSLSKDASRVTKVTKVLTDYLPFKHPKGISPLSRLVEQTQAK